METIISGALRSKAKECRLYADILETEAKCMENHLNDEQEPKYQKYLNECFKCREWKKWIVLFIVSLFRIIFRLPDDDFANLELERDTFLWS